MQYQRVEELREFVNLLQKQVEALELETYVGLTKVEQRDYYTRQERIRGLEANLDPPPREQAPGTDPHCESRH